MKPARGRFSMVPDMRIIMMSQSSERTNHRATEIPVGLKPGTAVTRVDLIEAVYRTVGLSRRESAKVVESLP
jgi:hypothetical protein